LVSDSEGEDGAGVERDEEGAADGGRSSSSRVRVADALAGAQRQERPEDAIKDKTAEKERGGARSDQ
jgi:hypothetical protein